MNVKRPKRLNEENEDDLMEFQEQFLKMKEQPSAKVVKRQQNQEINESEISQQLIDDSIKLSNEKSRENETAKYADYKITDKPSSSTILSDIIEKDTTNANYDAPTLSNVTIVRPIKLDENEIKAQKSTTKKSLFAQNLERQGKLRAFHQLNIEKEGAADKNQPSIKSEFKKSRILTGEGLTGSNEIERIHDENVEKLSNMSQEEILQEQERLLDTLDPKIISFIRKRGLNKSETTVEPTDKKVDESNKPRVRFSDLPLKPDKKWLNMNKIEYEKLAWMTDLPDNLSNKLGDSAPARFDFNGYLIYPNENLPPVTSALYHHGDQPEIPGYTLPELYQLTRSNFTQQRSIALQTLSNIIKNCHLNVYVNELKEPLLPQLIDSGIIFLLRWCLDDQNETIISICLEAFYNLLQPCNQEHYLDELSLAYNGHCQSSLYPFVNEDKDELNELTDLEYLKVDTIKALFRMNFINRLRYLLFNYQLKSKQAGDFIIQILFRIARHSLESCYELCEKYDIINEIVDHFLKIDLKNEGNIVSVDKVIKLIRLLSQSGRTIATNLYKNHDFKTLIMRYLTLEDAKIVIETINLLKVFSIFQLTNELINDFYEVLLRQLNSLINSNENKKLLKAYISFFDYLIKVNDNPAIIRPLFDSVSSFILVYIKENFSSTDFNLFATCFHYLANYFSICKSNDSTLIFNQLNEIEFIFNNILKQFTTNQILFDKVTSKLSEYSSIINTETNNQLKLLNSNNLSYLPTFLCPLKDYLSDDSIWPYDYLISFVKLLIVCLRFKRDLDRKYVIIKEFLGNNYLNNYLRKAFIVNDCEQYHADCFLFKYEYYFAYYCAKLALQMFNFDETASQTQDATFYHSIMLNLVTKFRNGDEYYVHDLFCNYLFNMNLWSHLNNATNENTNTRLLVKKIQNIKLNDNQQPKYLRTITGEVLKSNYETNEFEQELYDNLNMIKSKYISNVFTSNKNVKFDLDRSQTLIELSNLTQLHTLFTSKHKQTFLFNSDWLYIPIIMVQQQYQKQEKQKQTQNTPITLDIAQQTDVITNCLKYLFICELYRSDYMKRIPIIIRYSRLMSVFLTESQVFLDKNISLYLYLILLHYIQTNQISGLDFTCRIPGIIAFYDYYQHLLQNYDSESFGDPLYGIYLFLPIQQYCPVRYRQLIWSEYVHLFRFLRFNLEQEFIIPIENFVKPQETDKNMISLYAQALLSDHNFTFVSKSQVAYVISINHLNSYLFEQNFNENESEFRKNLFKQFYFSNNEQLKHDLFYFKCVSSENKVEFYEALPNIRQKWLNKMIE